MTRRSFPPTNFIGWSVPKEGASRQRCRESILPIKFCGDFEGGWGMELAAVRRYLAEHREVQPGTKIQYGHPSPRFWKPMQMSAANVRALRQPGRPLFLYLHIPFCPKTDPPACGFCLFAREDFTGYPAVVKYLEYMHRELELYAPHFAGETIECVYFGGGTPNVLRPRDY